MKQTQTPFVGISSTFITHGFTLVFSMIFSIIFTRILGPDGRGVMAVFISASGITVSLITLGFPTANAFFVAQDDNYLSKLFSNSLFLVIIFTILMTLILVLRPDIQKVFGVEPAYYQLGIYFLVINNSLTLLSQLLRDLLQGKKWFVQYNIASASSTMAYGVLGLILVVFLPNKITAILLASAISNVIPIALSLWYLFPLVHWNFSWKMFTKSATMGIRAYFVTLMVIAIARVNIFLISFWLDNRSTGFYSVASNLALLTATLPIAVVPVIFTFTASDKAAGLRLTLKINRLIFLLGLIANLILALLAVPLLKLYGSEFTEARFVLWLLLPGMLSYSIYLTLSSYFQGLGYPTITLLISLSGLVLNLGLSYWLIPLIGINGAAIGLSLSYIFMTIFGLIYTLRNNYNISLSDFFIPKLEELKSYLRIIGAFIKRVSLVNGKK